MFMFRLPCVVGVDFSSRPINKYKVEVKEYITDSFTNYKYIGNTKVSVSIKKLMPANAH